jgi:hypothetical protein
LDILQCPDEAKYVIKDKKSCIDDCTKDEEYKLLYNGNCVKECPRDTVNVDNVCKVDSDKCTYGENELNLYNNDLEVIGTLVKTYISEFGYTDKHISLYNNQNYSVMVYKTASCIKELSLEMPNVDFQSCYQKVQAAYNITQDLVISIAEKKDTSNPKTFFSFFHPVSGEKLNADEICKNDSIIVQENLNELLNKNDSFYEVQSYFAAQGINIFDKSDPFFTDMYYDFDNPLKKDIPINDRIVYFFPNVSLCDDKCQYNGINLEDMTASCDCKFNDISNNALIQDSVIMDTMVGEIFELISSSNLLVFKCFKYMFKHFSRSIGGWICLVLIIAQIAMVLLYFLLELPKMKIYLFSLTNRYISYISKKTRPELKAPPKRIIGNSKKILNNNNNINPTKPVNDVTIFDKKKDFDNKSDKIKLTKSKNKLGLNQKDDKPLISLGNSVDKKLRPKKNQKEETESKNDKEFFKEYLATSPDEMEFDDAYVFDKRTFTELFTEDLKENQIVAHTFIADDPLKPRTMKIIVFILVVLLYFVVNGLLFSEEVITELFEVDKDKENFFSYFPRSIERIIYSTLVSIVIGIITDLFFVDETKIKGYFRREKNQPKILKEKIVAFINDIKKRNIAFIVIASVILLVSFFYLLCFNYVYPYSQIEWIKSSITIVIVMQILSFLKCLLQSGLRFLSFKFNSEKLYKIGKLLD